MVHTDKRTDQELIQWDTTMPLLTDRFFLLDMFKVVFFSVGIMALMVTVIGLIIDPDEIGDILKLMPMFGLIGLGFLVVFALVCLVFYGNRFPCRFTVDHDGATCEVTARQRNLNRTVVILGALAGKPSAVGAGLMAQSQECTRYLWHHIHRVDLFPRQRVVILRNSWRSVLRIYCTPENYDDVVRIAQGGVERTARTRARYSAEDRKWRKGFVRDLGWTALALAATVLACAMPLLEDHIALAWGVGITLMLASLCGGPVRKGFGLIGLFMALGMILIMVGIGMHTREIIPGIYSTTEFHMASTGHDASLFYIGLLGTAGQLAIAVRSIGSGSGSVH